MKTYGGVEALIMITELFNYDVLAVTAEFK
jgi:hypothetical protein